jgi:CRP-like cAMP-binding protein
VDIRSAPATMPPPTANRLLAALPEAEYQGLLPHLEPFALPLGLTLYESGTQLSHVYFPTDGFVSLLCVMEDGSSGEIAVTGSEGAVGISLFIGGGQTTDRAVVLCSGHAYRLRAGYVMQEFERGGSLQHILLRFTQALITQMAQTAVCNRLHSVDQQLCRWLLLGLDRVPDNQINMTQRLIADMLGVRRESVTAAAGQLQSAGLISYRRGRITVLDRPALEKRVCECYAVVKRETERLLPRRFALRDQAADEAVA